MTEQAIKTTKATVVSTKMAKAIVVVVSTVKVHPKYKKRYKTRSRFSVACMDSAKFQLGDVIEITTCRPVSKTIHHKVIE
jgi:small subunit ribosomal protein S17